MMAAHKSNVSSFLDLRKDVCMKKILKYTGLSISIIMLTVSVVFIDLLINVRVVPVKYCIIAAVVLVILTAVTAFTQKWFVPGIITKIIAIIMIVVLIMGSIYLNQTRHMINKITTTQEEKIVMGVYVLNDSGYDSVDMLNNKSIGIGTAVDRESTDELIKKMGAGGFMAEYPEYSNIMELADALLQGQIDAAIMKTSSIEMIDEMGDFTGFASDVKLIYSGEFTIKVATTEENVIDNYLSSDDVINVYISGIDSRGGINEVSRSDVNIIMSVNKKTHNILMINTPRDYYVPLSISNGVRDKLTHAGVYGIECSRNTLEMLYGIQIDYYVKVNFSGFEKIIDSLGGVDVTLDYSATLSQAGNLTVHNGVNHFDGEQALAFARERYAYSDGDRQRGRNQMMIMEAAIKKACSPAIISNYTSVLSEVSKNVITDMSYDFIADLAQTQLNDMAAWNITQISVTGVGSYSSTTYSMPGWSLYIMVPDEESVENAREQIRDNYN